MNTPMPDAAHEWDRQPTPEDIRQAPLKMIMDPSETNFFRGNPIHALGESKSAERVMIESIVRKSIDQSLQSRLQAVEAAVGFFTKAGHPPEAIEVLIESGLDTTMKVRLRDANLGTVVANEIERRRSTDWHPMTKQPESGGYVLVYDGTTKTHHIAGNLVPDRELPSLCQALEPAGWYAEDDKARTDKWLTDPLVKWTYCTVPGGMSADLPPSGAVAPAVQL